MFHKLCVPQDRWFKRRDLLLRSYIAEKIAARSRSLGHDGTAREHFISGVALRMPKRAIWCDPSRAKRTLTSETPGLFDGYCEAIGGYRHASTLRDRERRGEISSARDKTEGRAYVDEVDAAQKGGEVPEIVHGSGEYLGVRLVRDLLLVEWPRVPR